MIETASTQESETSQLQPGTMRIGKAWRGGNGGLEYAAGLQQLAERAGVPVESVVRADMNTLGGGPLPSAAAGLDALDPKRLPEYGDLAYVRLRGALARRRLVQSRKERRRCGQAADRRHAHALARLRGPTVDRSASAT